MMIKVEYCIVREAFFVFEWWQKEKTKKQAKVLVSVFNGEAMFLSYVLVSLQKRLPYGWFLASEFIVVHIHQMKLLTVSP
jgi:hypothetical protein